MPSKYESAHIQRAHARYINRLNKQADEHNARLKGQYVVTLRQSVDYSIEVEAEDSKGAASVALEKWQESDDPLSEFSSESSNEPQVRIIHPR